MLFFIDWFFIIGMLIFGAVGVKMIFDAVMPAVVFVIVIVGIVLVVKLVRKVSNSIEDNDNYYAEEKKDSYWDS